MKRSILVAAVASAPLLTLVAPAQAQLSISTSTSTPVATATAVSNAPADINITSTGSVGVTVPGVAVTLNSGNSVTNAGAIGFTDISNATGILVQGGNTGSVTNTGTITLTETYAPTDTNNDGLIDGDFASGGNRSGISVLGTAPLTGSLGNFGSITVRGNGSYGVFIGAPVTGGFDSILVTPTVTAAAPITSSTTIASGAISITGNNSVGFYVAPTTTAGTPVTIGGNVRLSTVTATGVGAQAIVINGNVTGGVELAGPVSATGYRTTTRSSNPALSTLYTAQELSQGGTAVTIGGSVDQGILISRAPLILSTTNLDQDNNGVPDSLQGIGSITSYGSAPALQIGAAGLTAQIGPTVTGQTSTTGYSLVNQGVILGDGLFDTVTSPLLPAAVSATAVQIGVAPMGTTPGATVNLTAGILNLGSIQAQAYQADSTGIHIESGAAVSTIVNNGVIAANTAQINTAATGTGVAPQNVNAILIEAGANVGSIVNSSLISADLTGTGGIGGATGAIIDRSGTVANITNTGTITAELTQSLITDLMPGSTTAIDLSKGTGPQSLTQSANPAFAGANAPAAFNNTITYTAGLTVTENGVVYQALTASGIGVDPASNPAIWREIGAVTPSITGDVLFGSGGTTLTVNAGTINAGTIDLGAGVNTVNINNAGSIVSGRLLDEGNYTLTLNVNSGILSSTNPGQVKANSINVGATGALLAQGNPGNPGQASFLVSGSVTFAQGAQVGLTLSGLQTTPTETYTIVQTTGAGTITAGTFPTTSTVSVAPFLYSEIANYVPASGGAPAEITVTAGLKTQAQLGFTNAEESALNAILTAAPGNANLESALLGQTSQGGFKAVYDQLLPPQGQGLFDALDKAAQSVSALTATTPDAGTRVAGTSLWLQEVNERVQRTGLETQGSASKLLGLIAGYERMGPSGGAAGVTLAYYNDQETENAQQVGGGVVASMLEASAYYRRSIGNLTFAVRGLGGYSWFSSERRLIAPGVTEQANADWNGYFLGGHAGLAYEQRFGRFYARPEVSADYIRLRESAHEETGGDAAFDLDIASRTSTRLSGEAILVLGTQFGKSNWLRTEIRGGYREIFSGDVGDTVANFAGGSQFVLAPDPDNGGWATFGFSFKGGSPYSYVALEGDADFRSGEQRYDVRVAGRSIF